MSLLETISKDIMVAMKARESSKLEALRAIKSELLLAGTAEGANGEISEADELKILKKLVKQRKDSAEIYKEKGRTELYETEINQAAVIEQYLPAQLSEDKIEEELIAIVDANGGKDIKNMGKLMGVASKHFAGKADNAIVSKILKKLLAS